MRRAVLLAVMSLSAVSLAACGRDDTPKVVTKTQSDGSSTVTVTDNKGATVTVASSGTTASMPSYAPAFPGSTVVTTVTTPDHGGMVVFKTSASPDAVIAFYKKSVADAGFKDNLDMTSGDTTTFSASDTKSKHGVNVIVVKNEDGTQAQVTWN
jgi:hypothetical protein